MGKIIRVEHLWFSYDKSSKFIEDLNFDVQRGTYTCIIGGNGSGKTTVAKLLSGLIDSDKGNIFIDGIPLNNDSIKDIRNYLGMIFQNPDNQYVATTLKDDIIFGLENHNINPNEFDEIIEKVAKYCSVEELLDKEPSALSGGQKQKGAIAGILALNPKILILDEATSMLDSVSRTEINNLIKKLKDEQNLTIISITHDPNELLLADKIIMLDHGKIVFNGDKNEFFKLDCSKYNIDMPNLIQLERGLGYERYIEEENFFDMIGGNHESRIQ